jgi:hypothetical protein
MLAKINQIIREIPILRDASSKNVSALFMKDRE